MTHLRLPPRGPLLVSLASRRAFSSSLSIYPAVRRRARIAQRTAWLWGRTLGPSTIPGNRLEPDWPLSSDALDSHRRMWVDWFGPTDDIALIRPAQLGRTGAAALLMSRGTPRGFVKMRPDWNTEELERLDEVVSAASTFWAPAIIGVHDDAGWTSVGMTPLPGRLHRPAVGEVVAEVATEVAELLAGAFAVPTGWQGMHGDMGPWNLRRLAGGKTVLFDWEEAGSGPPGADLAFWSAAAAAVDIGPLPRVDHPSVTVQFWREEIPRRFASDARDRAMADRMLAALDRM